MPTVSVVLPTYNRGTSLRRSIESVLSQRFRDFELIVVNDGSTDDTEAIVSEFDDERVRYVAHRTNRGGSAARNTGIEASKGAYIAFLDDDDEWQPQKLDRQVDCLENRSTEWVAAHCDYRIIRHGTNRWLRRFFTRILSKGPAGQQLEGGAELIPVLLSMEFPLGGTSTLLARRTAIEEIGGFDPEFERHQDWEFLIRLLRVGKLAYVNEPLVTKHESSHPSGDSLRSAKQALFVKFSSEVEAAERDGYDITSVHRFDLAKHYYREGRFLNGTKYLRGAKVDPVGLLRTIFVGVYTKVERAR